MQLAKIQAGVTLIELMVSIAILSIILFIGVPSFQGTLDSSRARTITNDLAGALQLARSEALKRKGDVVTCISNDDRDGCGASNSNWGSGWLVLVPNTNPVTVVRVWEGISAGLGNDAIQAPSDGITFTREGFVKGSVSHQIRVDVIGHERCINISPSGQVTVSIGACS